MRAWAEVWGVPFLEIHRRVGSTNDQLMGIAEVKGASFSVVIADEQTAGRGRAGTRWHSPAGSGLLMSVLLPALSAPDPYAPLIVGLAVARAVETLADGVRAQIKWPNDVFIEGGKVAGILCESIGNQRKYENHRKSTLSEIFPVVMMTRHHVWYAKILSEWFWRGEL